ncbi:hypothetical protein WS98_21335 [Burkholderia territorii]|nr:hypothetical protein WS98_21335 [Burkholderia territorii]
MPASTLSTDCLDRLQRELDRIKKQSVNTPGMVELIRDLKARLMSDLPKELYDLRLLPITAPR